MLFILELVSRVEFSCLNISIYEAMPDAIGYLRHFHGAGKRDTEVIKHEQHLEAKQDTSGI